MSGGTTFGCQNWSGVGPLLARGDHFWLPKVVDLGGPLLVAKSGPGDHFWAGPLLA